MTEQPAECAPACSEQHTYQLSTCALACTERHGGVADPSWVVPCPRCKATADRPCIRWDGSAASVACQKRWDLADQRAVAARQSAPVRSAAQPTSRALALDAAAVALNAGRYWLPAEAQAAVVDAVAAVYEIDLDTARRRAVALVERIDAGRAWARQHLTVEQQTGLLGVLAGREDAAASDTPTDGLRDRYAAALRTATCTGNCDTSETECARTRIQAVVWEHGQLAEVSGSPEMLADTILATRDTELDRMRADRDRWQHGLEAAEAQLVQLRRTVAALQAGAQPTT